MLDTARVTRSMFSSTMRSSPGKLVTFTRWPTLPFRGNSARYRGAGAIMDTSMDDGPVPVRPQAVVAAYLLAALCLLIPLAIVGSTFAGIVLWRRGLRQHAAAVVGFGVACMVFGVTALR